MISKKSLIEIRPYRPEDNSFVMGSWLPSAYGGNDWFKEIDEIVFCQHYRKTLERILSKPDVQIQIACLKEDSDVLLAFSVFEGPILHYVFCKPIWRGIGLMKDLIPKGITTVTHITHIGKAILEKYPSIQFNPFLI